MNLYLISQDANKGYDTYDSAVVAAESPEEAVKIYPCEGTIKFIWDEEVQNWYLLRADKSRVYRKNWTAWTSPKNVKAVLIGTAIRREAGCICASFNAG